MAVFEYPEWDGKTPFDLYKWARQRAHHIWHAQQSSMLQKVGPDGKPLYRLTSGGSIVRTSTPSQATRLAVLDRDGHACVWCGSTDELHIDHIHRYSDGGSHDIENLRTLCAACNLGRGAN